MNHQPPQSTGRLALWLGFALVTLILILGTILELAGHGS